MYLHIDAVVTEVGGTGERQAHVGEARDGLLDARGYSVGSLLEAHGMNTGWTLTTDV